MPSSGVRTTSVESPRMVRATGTAIISFKRSMTSSRVRIRTGRRLSGWRNVYQRISPRFKKCSPSLRRPRQGDPLSRKTHQSPAGSRHSSQNRQTIVWRSGTTSGYALAGPRLPRGARFPRPSRGLPLSAFYRRGVWGAVCNGRLEGGPGVINSARRNFFHHGRCCDPS